MFKNNELPKEGLKDIDEPKFIDLYNKYWHVALQLARHLVQDSYAAEDIVQNVFISIWRRKDVLQIDGHIEHYLKRAIKLAAVTYIRDNSSKQVFLLASAESPSHSDADNLVLNKELQRKINHFVDQLPSQSRKVYHMRFDEALNNNSISTALGVSEKTVRNQVSITLKRIRLYLREAGY